MSSAVAILPEQYEIANAYVQYGDIKTTAYELDVPQHEVARILKEPAVKRYLDSVYLDMGYRNRSKLGNLLDKIIDSKLEEAEESGVYTSKDLVELITLAHKFRMDQIKAEKEEKTIDSQTNIQVNQYGDSSYGKLMERLLEKK